LENRRLLRIAKLRDNICGDSVGGVFFLIHIYIYIHTKIEGVFILGQDWIRESVLVDI